MFDPDYPIESSKDDLLSRVEFSQHLANALIRWEKEDSLIVALYGRWGAGKTSIINMAMEEIDEKENSINLTVLRFNPWLFSDLDNLTGQFFKEIANELELKNEAERDRKIAEQLRLYAAQLSMIPDTKEIKDTYSSILSILGLTTCFSPSIFKISDPILSNFLIIIGVLLVGVSFSKSAVSKLASFFEKRSKLNEKSAHGLKKEIKRELQKRKKKLLVIVDDIDRLNSMEVRQIFRLIRINADFPNTIYLLSFDRNIIEEYLGESQGKDRGRDYLEKIVHVNFNVPYVKSEKISEVLMSEIENLIQKISPEAKSQDYEKHLINVYNSGLKNLIDNIRDIKRLKNGVVFNLKILKKGETLEVNPVDFIAIETIRVFFPEYYNLLKSRNELFTSTKNLNSDSEQGQVRLKEIENSFQHVEEDKRKYLKEMMMRLFPQIYRLLRGSYMGNIFVERIDRDRWVKECRVCSREHFDTYFTLVPGGDEKEVSQDELNTVFSKIKTDGDITELLKYFVVNNKIKQFFIRFRFYTEEENLVPKENLEEVIKSFFKIAEDLGAKKASMYDISLEERVAPIIRDLLLINDDPEKSFEILQKAFEETGSLYSFVDVVRLETAIETRKEKTILNTEQLKKLRNICCYKIKARSHTLLDYPPSKFRLLYRCWRKWAPTGRNAGWKAFLENAIEDKDKIISLIENFHYESRSHNMRNKYEVLEPRFQRGILEKLNLKDKLLMRLHEIRKTSGKLYEDNAEYIDFVIDYLEKEEEEDGWPPFPQ